MIANRGIATISASGADSTLNLFAGNAPLGARIAGELAARGLVVLSSSVDRGFSGLSSYAFVFTAELASDNPGKQWSDALIRSFVNGAIAAATTFPASTSIVESRIPIIADRTFIPTTGGSLPGGSGGETPQQVEGFNIPILGDAISSVRRVVQGVGTVTEIALVAVAVLVVGGVILVLTKPETIRKVTG